MTELDICSDLHLEFDRDCQTFGDWKNKIDQLFDNQQSDNIIIAGDLFSTVDIVDQDEDKEEVDRFNDGIQALNDVINSRYKNGIFVLGNHDYWRHDIIDSYQFWTNVLDSCAVIDVNQSDVCHIGDVVVIGSTLWSTIPNNMTFFIERYMNDYRYIKNHDKHLSINDTIAIANQTIENFDSFCNLHKDKRIVIVTHHVPSWKCKTSDNNFGHFYDSAYFNDLDDLINKHDNLVGWVYGHDHHKHDDIKINNCKLVSNPRGYMIYDRIADDFKLRKVSF